MITKPYDELELGEEYVSRGRTITETDVVNFCALTGNWLEIHSNKEFAHKTEIGERLVQGSLIFSIIAGLVDWDPTVIVAFYGVDRIRFTAPVLIGDTVHVVSKVIEKNEKDEKRGVVSLEMKVFNQKEQMVQTCIFKLLARKKRLSK